MIDHYRQILDDRVRVLAFERAIEATVRPGDVVLDLGCALGNFTAFACRAGARRVYAVECEPVIETAQQVIAANGFADRVRFLRGRSTELDPPERARVVFFEDFVITLLSPGVVRTLRDAVDRWLAPGGVLLPGRARVWTAPVEHAIVYQELDRFAAAGERAYGLDVGATRPPAFATTYVRSFPAGSQLAAPVSAGDVDLARVQSPALRARGRVPASRSGVIHGLALWFELDLAGEWLGTGPSSPRTAWAQAFFPLAVPLVVDRGDPIELGLESGLFGDELVWHWNVAVGERRVEGSNLEALTRRGETLARWDPDRVPAADAELELDRCILAAVDGARSLEEIADAVRARFPDRLTEAGALERRVLSVIDGRRTPTRG